MNIRRKPFALILGLLLTLTSCRSPLPNAPNEKNREPSEEQPPSVAEVSTALPDAAVSVQGQFTADTFVSLKGDSAEVSGDGVFIEGNTVTVTKAGTYLLTGVLEGQLRVNTEENASVELLFNGVDIRGNDNSAVYILSAPKHVVISTVKGSKNILTDAQAYKQEHTEDQPTACLFSMEDLILEGDGELYVFSAGMKGIYSKDDLKIKSGTLKVVAADDGIRGKDSLSVTGGTLQVYAGADGLKATNNTKNGKGTVSISGGTTVINAGDEGIDAVSKITLAGGSVSIKTGGGSAAAPSKEDGGFGGGGFGGGGRPPRHAAVSTEILQTAADNSSTGGKGVKSDTEILLCGCELTIDSYDDALHATESVSVSGGKLFLSSGDDGIHCDKNVIIEEGEVRISKSYEGIEGQYITVSGGKVYVTSSDDGMNATDGSSLGGFGGGFGRPGGAGQDCALTFKGGYTVINAAGDGVDSNGNIYMDDGTLIIFGPSDNGNGAIDTGDGQNNSFFFTNGNLLAIGSSGMMEGITSELPSLAVRTGNISASQNVYILDQNGKCCLAFTAPKAISSIVFASSNLERGKLEIYTGGTLPVLTDNAVFFPEECPTGGKLLGDVNIS